HRRGLLATIVPGEAIWPNLDRAFTDLARPVGLDLDWDYGTRATKSPPARLWGPRFERTLALMDPPLRLEFWAPGSAEADLLSRRRLWIYSGVLGFSLIVIIVGLWVMRKAVQREIEVANLKADFVANVSHELRTPLATISYIGERLSTGRYRSDG